LSGGNLSVAKQTGGPHAAGVNFRTKLLTRDQVPIWRERMRQEGRRVVATNGCFDILHFGHANYLEAARNQGNELLVGVNSDASVRKLKGPTRPINQEISRASVLAALESVSAVYIFPELEALEFLRLTRPDVYVKGGDYTIETINQPERRLVESLGGKVVVLGGVPGYSTTGIIEKMKSPA
jgi:rfaE bifunctional protein nucleotidyltransferase chain/domain